ncbi:CDP-glycerol glycerophosphotransferase family protein [Sporolactobacillus sp. Y61]|uniref:CDP-glycerol glycerophosphotransferase family protein n=1 Tax=Sporolactobacillus sp. Y61 TaxID=3160863 RepID=A0AAU8ICW7_9BACL
MIREAAVFLYLLYFRIIFFVFKICCRRKNKIVFVVSFSDNPKCVAREIMRQGIRAQLIFLCRGKCIDDFKGQKVLPFETDNPVTILLSAYHLATASVVFVDNYYGFLSVVHFKKGVRCLQLWHAAGAMKTFGLEDHTVSFRSKQAKRRFLRVYSHFDQIVVGSDRMAEIFSRSFHLDDKHMLRSGVPRTDRFYDRNYIRDSVNSITSRYGKKKKILYAPTFREGQGEPFQLSLDLDLMERELGKEYLLFLRLHPLDHLRYARERSGWSDDFVIDCTDWPDLNPLLCSCDLLITDYSSIPFEYALLHKPMIFYIYDLNQYQKERGLQKHYLEGLPGPAARSTEEVVSLIQRGAYDLNKIEAFAEEWNTYSRGHSSRNVVDFMRSAAPWLQSSTVSKPERDRG